MKIITKHPYWETKYGFHWGAMEIERTASLDDGSVVVTIKTPKEILEVRATKTGFIRTERKSNEEVLRNQSSQDEVQD